MRGMEEIEKLIQQLERLYQQGRSEEALKILENALGKEVVAGLKNLAKIDAGGLNNEAQRLNQQVITLYQARRYKDV